MKKVVLDTSTFIRATLEQDRNAFLMLTFLIAKCEFLYSDETAKELLIAIHQVANKKKLKASYALRTAATILLNSKKITPKTLFPWCSDPEDSMFIECAIDGGAETVISNDHSLTALKNYLSDEQAIEMVREIEFLTPEQFLEKIKK